MTGRRSHLLSTAMCALLLTRKVNFVFVLIWPTATFLFPQDSARSPSWRVRGPSSTGCYHSKIFMADVADILKQSKHPGQHLGIRQGQDCPGLSSLPSRLTLEFLRGQEHCLHKSPIISTRVFNYAFREEPAGLVFAASGWSMKNPPQCLYCAVMS